MIRRAEERDIPYLLNLLEQVNLVHHLARPDIFKKATKYNEDELKEIIKDDNKPIFVYDEDGAVTGYAFTYYIKHEKDNILTDIKTLYIDDLCVDSKKRKSGIGHKLYEYVKGFAKDQGCYNLTLNVWYSNESALRFYKSLDLEPLKIMMEKIL